MDTYTPADSIFDGPVGTYTPADSIFDGPVDTYTPADSIFDGPVDTYTPADSIFDGPVGTYTPADSIFDGPVTSLLSTLYILIEIPSHALVKWGKVTLMTSHLAFLVGRFPSDGVTSMAENGLRSLSALPAIASAKTESSFLCPWLDNTLHSYSPL